MNYHVTFNNSTMTNSEFFRQNAPNNSVARERVQTMSVFNKSGMGSTMRSTQSTFQTSIYATPFILDRDVTNKYRVVKDIERSQQFLGAVPFLRTPMTQWKHVQSSKALKSSPRRNNYARSANATFTEGFGIQKTPLNLKREKHRLNKKESGWESYIKPISKFNEKVHTS